MPPVQHWGWGICRVPADLPEQARVALDLITADPAWFWEQINLNPEDRWDRGNYTLDDWNAVWGLRPLYWYSQEFVAVDAHSLSVIRNMLDADVMNGLGCEEHAEEAGVAPPPADVNGNIVDYCMWCDRCRALIMRDRIDVWLDRSGHTGSPYYQAYGRPDPTYDIERDWALVWSGATYPSAA